MYLVLRVKIAHTVEFLISETQIAVQCLKVNDDTKNNNRQVKRMIMTYYIAEITAALLYLAKPESFLKHI